LVKQLDLKYQCIIQIDMYHAAQNYMGCHQVRIVALNKCHHYCTAYSIHNHFLPRKDNLALERLSCTYRIHHMDSFHQPLDSSIHLSHSTRNLQHHLHMSHTQMGTSQHISRHSFRCIHLQRSPLHIHIQIRCHLLQHIFHCRKFFQGMG